MPLMKIEAPRNIGSGSFSVNIDLVGTLGDDVGDVGEHRRVGARPSWRA